MSAYAKKLLKKGAVNQSIVTLIGNSTSEDENEKYYFHKIMVYDWDNNDYLLYEAISEYFSVSFVPVNFSSTNAVTTFYTSSLALVLKIINLGFIFPNQRKLINIEILLNDKTSLQLFGSKTTLEDIVTGVVSNRFKPNYELDLSNFCNDEEFLQHKIHFYKISLLANFKILMLRMSRDCKIINLSNNQLREMPQEIMNFFIKGDLIGLNLSHNNMTSLASVQRINSKIEVLWIEGNTFGANMNEMEYIKEITKKFPRVVELDGIKINNYGITVPFHKHFILNDEYDTQYVVEEFVKLYFAHYDHKKGRNIEHFYDAKAIFTLSANLNDIEKVSMPKISMYSRNLHKPNQSNNTKSYFGVETVVSVLRALPSGSHDLTSFSVDIIHDYGHTLVLVIDGLFREEVSDRYFSFRRTFVLKYNTMMDHRHYLITNEMFTISLAPKDLKESFQGPTRHLGELRLIEPTTQEQECMIKILRHLSHLKKPEAESRLKKHSWDLRECLAEFKTEVEMKSITDDAFSSDDDIQSLNSSIIYEID
ncbi:nuclear RNA export factor 1-like [Aricia agestis]|uniref:nuclear RNA export factor 1-like n=1 Tax=Aricia agestis TaxID=91739 RepID=UPI001C207C33|nr:nuclear RNA export factor 1-like [Aricia agestis]